MGKFWVRCLLIEKDVFSSCHERGTKKKILSPHEESHCRPSDSALRRSDAPPLSRRDSVVSRARYGVYIWHASCILLGSATSFASCFVNRIRKMVSFELGKEIEKGVFLCPRLVTRRKTSLYSSLPSFKTYLPSYSIYKTFISVSLTSKEF